MPTGDYHLMQQMRAQQARMGLADPSDWYATHSEMFPDDEPIFSISVVAEPPAMQAIACPNCGVLFLDRLNTGICRGCTDPSSLKKHSPAPSLPPTPKEPFVYIDPNDIDIERY